MRYHIYFSFISIAKTVLALIFTSDNAVTIDFNINFKSKCQLITERFAFFYGLSIAGCVEECGLRKHCKALNFWRRIGGCELFHSAEEGVINDGSCSHILATDIEVLEQPCDECSVGEVCDASSNNCRYKECPKEALPLHSENTGNVFAVGGTIHYKCKEDFTTGGAQGTAKCLDNGQWNSPDCVGVSCGNPPLFDNATVVLDRDNGIFYTDNATVTCDAWFQTRKNTITCTITGDWETTYCADCYLDTVWTYTGKRNWTVTGKPCFRWDSPEVIARNWNDLQYYPESALSEAMNFCRNPAPEIWEPWCIITNENIEDYWEYCDVGRCIEN